MSATTAVTIVAVVLIMAALVAYIAWLGRQGNCINHRHHVGGCIQCLLDLRLGATHQHHHEHPLVDHDHEGYAHEDHNHDGVYARIVHNHDDRYTLVGHRHDNDYAPLRHTHQEYVTHEQLSRRIHWQGIVRSVFVETNQGILHGILIGGVIGAIVGLVLDLTLPRSVFETHANTTYTVDGREIDQVLTAYNVWPMFGIPLGCIVVGMLLGGIILWIVSAVRNRRQIVIEENR
jgi:hypothetical protein